MTDVAARIAAIRSSRDLEEQRTALNALAAEEPDDGLAQAEAAYAHDRLGREAEAIEFYRAALEAGGLGPETDRGVRLGLGSSLRALGRYGEAAPVLDEAVARHPGDGALAVFRAMALYNSGRTKEAVEALLLLLADTTGDERISGYEGAIRTYAEDLDRTW